LARYENSDSGKPGKPYQAQAVDDAVAKPSPVHDAMCKRWAVIRTVLGGTEAMRDAGKDMLPMHPYESEDAWKSRRDGAVLDNYTRRTLDTLVGKAFREPPAPGDDVPEVLLTFLEDVDGEGTGFATFSRGYFRSGVRDAVAYLLVDHTAAQPREDGQPRTKADDARDGLRPFWRVIDGVDMIGPPQMVMQGGQLRPVLVRFRDDELQPDGDFGEKLVERVKVLRPGSWEVWEKQAGTKGAKPKWVLADGGSTSLDFIPLIQFYTDKEGIGEGRPPLLDLAHMNVRHWVSTADQNNILTVSRFPMLAVSGVQSDENGTGAGQIVIGPRKLLTTADPQAKIYFVEHTGSAVNSGKDDLERLEERMSSYGAEFLTKKTGTQSATGRALDGAEAISQLQAWGLDFKDALELALKYTGIYLGLKGENEAGTIEFEVDQDVDVSEPAELGSLDAARTRKDISRKAWAAEMKRRGILSEEYDVDDDQEEIDQEAPPPGTGLDGMVGPDGTVQEKPLAAEGDPAKKPKTKPGAEKPPKE
jgi:hypothetical protein